MIIGFTYVLLDLSFHVSSQLLSGSTGKNDLLQTNGKRVIWVKEHKFKTTTKGGWGILEMCFCQVFANSIVFEQLIYCSFWQTMGVGVKKLVIFCGCHKQMTLNISDWMNLAVTQDPRDHGPGHPRVQNK